MTPDPATSPDAPADTESLPQVGALPLRHAEDGSLRIALLTSRETKRWVIPKGWPMRGVKDHKAAGREAKQEAGLVGRVDKAPLGSYVYWKRRPGRVDLCRVAVYRMTVDRQLKSFREQGQRQLRWFTLDEAAGLVDEPELGALIRAVDAD